MLFFQVGKEDFRKTYWQAGSQDIAEGAAPGGRFERASFWVARSFEKWGETFADPNVETLRDAITPSVSRIALLNQTANVVDMTPSVVPYQYGALYSYLGVTLIPRFLWPNKPSVNEANQFYQVAYGLTAEDDLDRKSTRLNSSHANISYAVFCLKKKKQPSQSGRRTHATAACCACPSPTGLARASQLCGDTGFT